MALTVELDCTDVTPEELERGRLEPGWYHVAVDDVTEDDKSGAIVLELVVKSGPFAKAKIHDRLSNPGNAADEEKAKFARNRMALVAKRIGLLADDGFGGKVSLDWTDAINKECYVEVKERTYKDAKTQQEKKTVNVDFAGYYPLGDARVPVEARTHPGADKTLMGGGANGAGTKKPATPSPAAGANGKPAAANGQAKPAAAAAAGVDQFANL